MAIFVGGKGENTFIAGFLMFIARISNVCCEDF